MALELGQFGPPPLGMIYTIFVGDHYTIIPTILVYLMIHIAKPINMLLGKLFLTDNIPKRPNVISLDLAIRKKQHNPCIYFWASSS